MNYSAIKYNDIANGEGVRTSLFVSGCTHHCPGCFNEIAWPFDAGEVFDAQVQDKILESIKPDWIAGLSVLGGEPFEIVNQRALYPFLARYKEMFPAKTLWIWTGYVYEPDLLAPNGRAHCEVTGKILDLVDILVDGPFILAQKDISLAFRGSSNQRILKIAKS